MFVTHTHTMYNTDHTYMTQTLPLYFHGIKGLFKQIAGYSCALCDKCPSLESMVLLVCDGRLLLSDAPSRTLVSETGLNGLTGEFSSDSFSPCVDTIIIIIAHSYSH